MKNFIYFLLLSLFCSIGTSHAQSAQNALKKGNKNYEDKKYIQAETSYRLAQSKNKENNVAEYNMGNSLYRQKLSNEAIATYLRAIKNAKTKEDKHRAFHNLGNAYLKEKKYKEAEDAYKNALRNNPKDDETRYNFALAKKLNQEHPDQNQDNKDNKDQNKDNQDKQDNQDQNKNDQQNKQDQDKDDKSNDDKNSDNKNDKDNQQNKDQSDQDKNDNQDQNDSDSEPKPTPQQQASKDQMERLLEAINQEERKVQQRLINKDKKGEGKETTGQGTNKKDW